MEYEFVALRGARAKVTDAFGGKTYSDVWDNMSQLELNYYLGRWLRVSPEGRAKYFGKTKRIEDKEVYKWFSDYKKNPRKNIMDHKLPPPLGHYDIMDHYNNKNQQLNHKASLHTK